MEQLIPQDWFTGLHWSILAVIIVVATTALIKGADWLVEGASGVAYRLGMPKVIVGATIVSLGTTSPEAAVSVMAAWGGNAGLSLGNAVGSIIADTGLIFGIGCLLTSLPADRFVLSRQGWVQFGSAVVLAALCYALAFAYGEDAKIGQWVGVLFIAGLLLYLHFSVRWARQHPQGEIAAVEDVAEEGRGVAFLISLLFLGLLVVVFSGRFLIGGVQELAFQLEVPSVVVAATIVAFGTSLPELVVGIMAIRKKHPELLVGNVVGADILNVLFVVGASALASPLAIPWIFLAVHLPTMIIILILFRIYIAFAVRTGRFRRMQGLPLVIIYVVYVIVQYAMGIAEGGGAAT